MLKSKKKCYLLSLAPANFASRVKVESDRKHLESLFKKPLSLAPQRIQRMMLREQQYDLMVKYRRGDQLNIADTLSSASQLESTSQAA